MPVLILTPVLIPLSSSPSSSSSHPHHHPHPILIPTPILIPISIPTPASQRSQEQTRKPIPNQKPLFLAELGGGQSLDGPPCSAAPTSAPAAPPPAVAADQDPDGHHGEGGGEEAHHHDHIRLGIFRDLCGATWRCGNRSQTPPPPMTFPASCPRLGGTPKCARGCRARGTRHHRDGERGWSR